MTPPELVAARGPAGGYIHAASAFDDELGRLLLLEARYDTQTFRRLSACGPLSGGGSGEAEFLRRSLERMRTPILGCGVAAEEEFEAVLAATADTSFSFVDALSVAAWARNPD